MEKNNGERSFLFNVDIMLEADTSGQALEQLLHILNHSTRIEDYRIMSGIDLGGLIQEALKLASDARPIPDLKAQLSKVAAADSPEKGKSAAKTKGADPLPTEPDKPGAGPQSSGETVDIIKQIHDFIAKNTLIRLTVLKGKGVKLSLPCRIVAYDSTKQTVTVYHVDEKKVYQFRLNEIDDFIV